MKTIHIEEKIPLHQKRLLKDLYKKFLYKDPLFHYFIEPELIIRVSKEKVLNEIKDYLKKEHLLFYVYDYPKPKHKDQYGENIKAILRNFDTFAKVFHEISLFNLNLKDNDKIIMKERFIHALYNTDFYDAWKEAGEINGLGLRRAFIAGLYYPEKKEAKKDIKNQGL